MKDYQVINLVAIVILVGAITYCNLWSLVILLVGFLISFAIAGLLLHDIFEKNFIDKK